MDPIATAAIAGAAGSLMRELSTKSLEWLSTLIKSHTPKMQLAATNNFHSFGERLARRIQDLEASLSPSQKKVFDQALDHPSSSMLIQKAVISAASTDVDERHEILSELIAQRLTAGADDMVALAGGAACDVVESLSTRQIHLLSVMATLYSIRPEAVKIADQAAYDLHVLRYWDRQLSTLCTPDLLKSTDLDYSHLSALRCITYNPFIGRDLTGLFSVNVQDGKFTVTAKVLEECSWWPTLTTLWNRGITRTTLTSIGTLIGILHHDSVMKSRTVFRWNDPPAEEPAPPPES